MRTCPVCGETLSAGLDWRYKYCSDECAEEGHRRLCKANYRRRYWANREEELERNRRYYAAKKIMRPMAQGE